MSSSRSEGCLGSVRSCLPSRRNFSMVFKRTAAFALAFFLAAPLAAQETGR